ncbi:MAG: GGDEF domain-containing protein, partial [Afipia sp.]|nr:GGDEF domain-containing protein [Afipia sp.]
IVNDTLGHDVGDQLLQTVARRIAACLRKEDTIGRQGGDEFIVLLNSLGGPGDAAVVAQKILDHLSAPLAIGGQDLHTHASIGIALYPEDGADVESLLRNSDTAMYDAKASGRNTYRFFAQK